MRDHLRVQGWKESVKLKLWRKIAALDFQYVAELTRQEDILQHLSSVQCCILLHVQRCLNTQYSCPSINKSDVQWSLHSSRNRQLRDLCGNAMQCMWSIRASVSSDCKTFFFGLAVFRLRMLRTLIHCNYCSLELRSSHLPTQVES